MADEAIFVFNGGNLTALKQTPYENEPILQKALATYPDLIAGSATTGHSGRLLLVRREMPVTGPSGTANLSLDHLFIDSTGVPVLVEVKRSSDTRARREVVAQMLDYAANGTAYWPVETLRAMVEQAATQNGQSAESILQDALGVELEPEDFWRTVQQNLRDGRVRLIFLADQLTSELIRIIEFLNEQMRDTGVLGIELPQYTGGDDLVVYVPRLVGRTTDAQDAKRGTRTIKTAWTRETMLAQAREIRTDAEVAFIDQLISDVSDHGGHYSWGVGASAGVTGWYPIGGTDTPVWNVNVGTAATSGLFYFIVAEFRSRHEARMEEWVSVVASVGKLAGKVQAARLNSWKGWMSLPLSEAAPLSAPILAALDSIVEISAP